ncbi:hypothetical protein JCM8547_002705 [Rhodosporidiobolus lusitaniae]
MTYLSEEWEKSLLSDEVMFRIVERLPKLKRRLRDLSLYSSARLGRHILFNPDERDDSEPVVNAVRQVTGFVKTRNLSSVSLPLHLPVNREHDEPIHSLLELCKTRKVDLLWYHADRLEQYEVSRSFWRYSKELKAKQEATSEGGQGA